eukprot:2716779-Alexandrium_andersonii.AAC.1
MLASGSPIHLSSINGLSASLSLLEGEPTEELKHHGLQLLISLEENVDWPLSVGTQHELRIKRGTKGAAG